MAGRELLEVAKLSNLKSRQFSMQQSKNTIHSVTHICSSNEEHVPFAIIEIALSNGPIATCYQ